jgi:hypothetical protein
MICFIGFTPRICYIKGGLSLGLNLGSAGICIAKSDDTTVMCTVVSNNRIKLKLTMLTYANRYWSLTHTSE